jgi:hypothetical protein
MCLVFVNQLGDKESAMFAFHTATDALALLACEVAKDIETADTHYREAVRLAGADNECAMFAKQMAECRPPRLGNDL